MRYVELQVPQERHASRGVAGTYRRNLADHGQQVADPADQLVELRGRLLRLAQRQIVNLRRAAAPEVELVVGLDRHRGQQGYRHQQEQPMGERHRVSHSPAWRLVILVAAVARPRLSKRSSTYTARAHAATRTNC